MLAILRRKGLGNGSTRAIQSFLKEMGTDVAIVRQNDEKRHILVNGRWVRDPNMDDYDKVLRWGYTGEMGYDEEYTINLSKHIHLVNDKPACRKALVVGGIKVPMTFYRKEDIAIANFPLIGRPTRHAQGKHITISRNHDDLRRDNISTYWSEIIDKDREFRVYTFFGKIIMVAEKIPTEIGRQRLAWNHFGGGATFENVRWRDWPIEVCKEALKASNVIGIDFAGVDVMSANGVPYILEINSAHSLTSEYRQQTFAKALDWLLKEWDTTGAKPIHFEYPTHIRTYKSMLLKSLRNA